MVSSSLTNKYRDFLYAFKACFQSETRDSSKTWNKRYTRGHVKRTNIYWNITTKARVYRGYLYYNPKYFKTDEQAFTYWLRLRKPRAYKALMKLITSRVMTQPMLIREGFEDIASLEIMAQHAFLGIHRKFLHTTKPVIYYTLTETQLSKWMINELPKLLFKDKSDFIKQALSFESKCEKLLRKHFGKKVKIEHQAFRTGTDKACYKFDLIVYKKFPWLGRPRPIPIIVECKSFFLSNKAFFQVVYFNHKVIQCYPTTPVLKIIMCNGAGDKTLYDRAGQLGVWIWNIQEKKETRKLKN